jgi:uncharacterized protein YdeI (YjbR/CyaY-like superfamily)
MVSITSEPLAFVSAADLDFWLKQHHASSTELWVRLWKKTCGVRGISREDCTVKALAWGWIDGIGKTFDDQSYVIRLTPRRPGSGWSQRNCAFAEQLIAEGQMHPPGQAQVDAARADGRWARAYAGSASMEMPADFTAALSASPAAADRFGKLSRAQMFAIYLRLQRIKRAENRARAIQQITDDLAVRQVP